MAVRNFDHNVGDRLRFSVGNLVDVNNGAFTMAALVKKASDDLFMPVCSADSASTSRRSLWVTDTDVLMANMGGSNIDTPVGFDIADDWCVVAVTKPAGNELIRGHKGVLGGAWTHDDGDEGFDDGSVVDGFTIGSWQANTFFNGLIGLVGAWKRELDDAEFEDGFDTALTAWLDASPTGLWALDQASTATAVTDLTGGGADQVAISGTAVETVDVPDFDFTRPTTSVFGFRLNAITGPAFARTITGPGV